MKEFIQQIFLQSGFELHTQEEHALLFTGGGQTVKKSYWLILERAEPLLLEDQADLFIKYKFLVDQQEFDKNCSLLLLVNTTGTTIDQQFRNRALLIEDNPFYFKKYVLWYTDQEFEAFTNARNNRAELGFLERHMVSRSSFDAYKTDPRAESWQALLFRLALKIPFVNVKVDIKPGLSALFDDNHEQLVQKGLNLVDDDLGAYLFDKTTDEIGRIPAIDLLNALNLNQKQNGDQTTESADTEL
ncbi:ABC-three component system middle component 1 [Mucilaginibacter sp. CAU 1740]|uniref:ABC-three component system middle component 1 n=1 Tax=Mucilaginibacter sp. CAU 1740 TaxID=3140365 RepID=UPI00325AB2AF